MRIVLGIDHGGYWKTAGDLLTRLRFRDGVVDTVHVVEPPACQFGEPIEALVKLVAEQDEKADFEGQRQAEEASAALRDRGHLTGACTVSSGHAAAELLQYADKVTAGVIAVGSSGKGAVKSFLLGSVGRGILIGSQLSVLIARGSGERRGPLRAVLATDHSVYANRCIDTLLHLAPQGISNLTVLTTYPKDALEALRPFLPDFVLDPAAWIEEGLAKRNAEVMARLEPLGCRLDSRVRSESVHDAIRQAMEETQADLLILGAQGHGFIERLTLGSVSFQEGMTEPHSVLVLRAPDGTDLPQRKENP
ncbi:MAG: universal stress protein [Armatimonadota bacterium]